MNIKKWESIIAIEEKMLKLLIVNFSANFWRACVWIFFFENIFIFMFQILRENIPFSLSSFDFS